MINKSFSEIDLILKGNNNNNILKKKSFSISLLKKKIIK